MERFPLATLLTDFGTSDPYVAVVKGVILRHCPGATIIDLAHEIPPQGVPWAAFVLAQSMAYFPEDTLHVVVVDPGVGTRRRVLAGRVGNQRVLGPDNGVLSLAAERLGCTEMVAVDQEALLEAPASATFHGRDVFAPLAGRILGGLAISRMGPPAGEIVRVDFPQPQAEGDSVTGCVVYVDRFGNLVSNIDRASLAALAPTGQAVDVLCGGRLVGRLCPTYAAVEPGSSLALINSMDLLEVAVRDGSAAASLGGGLGTEIRAVRAGKSSGG